MYKFKTISVKDWEHAVDENASERTKKLRHKKLALRALKEVAPKYFGPWPTRCETSTGCYSCWRVTTFNKAGYFVVHITEAKIWIVDVDVDGNKTYPCGMVDWNLDTNLAEV